MSRVTKQELAAEADRLRRSEGILQTALQLVVCDDPEATERVKIDGGVITLRLFGSRRADGGLVVETFSAPGQRPQVSAKLLDSMRVVVMGSGDHDSLKLACAVERLTIVRNTLAEV